MSVTTGHGTLVEFKDDKVLKQYNFGYFDEFEFDEEDVEIINDRFGIDIIKEYSSLENPEEWFLERWKESKQVDYTIIEELFGSKIIKSGRGNVIHYFGGDAY